MPICLDMFLAAGRYDAAEGQDPRNVEWPPHPARVFSALRSVAADHDLPLLRELEQLPPPTVHACTTVAEGGSRAYVVTNTISTNGGNLSHPGRTSGLRERRFVVPVSPRVQFVWKLDEGLSDAAVARLDALARRVPYLGRSTSFVLMGIQRLQDVAVPDGLDAFEPDDRAMGGLQLRVPYVGFTDELDALFQQNLSAWQASDGALARHSYKRVDESPSPADSSMREFRSPYRDLVVLRFSDRRPSGNLTPIFTAALRSMVLGQTAEPLPPALHGHGFDGNPHVAYLGLPVCGGSFADGHLVGLAVAVPGLEEGERHRIIRGILGKDEGAVNLHVPGFRERFKLAYRPDDPLPTSATDRHWKRASRQWVTATPIVLDRYPKNGDLAASVLQSITLAGLPEPALVEVSTAALTPGAVALTPKELPRRARGRLYCHARITFGQPVAGPVLAGAGRYFGVGLFQPERYQGE